jgi:protein SCO1
MQTAEMAQLQEEWKDKAGLKLVSFSVDPEKDTTAVLSRYADHYKADTQRWLFLTGAKEEIGRLVQEGFRLSAVALPGDGNVSSVIMHSPRFVLIDKQVEIRGYYDSRDPQALQRLKADVATLINR